MTSAQTAQILYKQGAAEGFGGSHEKDSFLHVLGQAADSSLPIQGLAVVDDIDMTAQRPQITCGIMMQILQHKTFNSPLLVEGNTH